MLDRIEENRYEQVRRVRGGTLPPCDRRVVSKPVVRGGYSIAAAHDALRRALLCVVRRETAARLVESERELPLAEHDP
jgi:hypothetical protein